MAEERIDIVISDKRISAGITKKLEAIAVSAERANAAVNALRLSLASLGGAVTPLTSKVTALNGATAVAAASLQTMRTHSAGAASAITKTSVAAGQAAKSVQAYAGAYTMLGMGGGKPAAAVAVDRISEAMRNNAAQTAVATHAVREYVGAHTMLGMGGGKPAAAVAPPVTPFMGGTSSRVVQSAPTAVTSTSASSLPGMGGGAASAAAAAAQVAATAPKTAAAIKKVGTAAQATTGHLISLGGVLRTMFMTYFAVAAAERILNIADSYQQLENKLRTVTKTSDGASEMLGQLVDVANESRTSLDATVTLYQRMALAMGYMGATSEQVKTVVRNVNTAMALSGATAQETTGAIRQLSQAFNKGKADGDEFRSMMENAPILMDAIAAEMGVARHELVALAPQGKITAEIMFNALQNVEGLSEQLTSMPITLDKAMTQLGNSFVEQLGLLNDVTQANRNLANVISGLSRNVDILIVSMIVLFTVVTVTKINAITTAFWGMAAAVRAAVASVGPIGWAIIALTMLGSAAYVVWQRTRAVDDAMVELKDMLVEVSAEVGKASPFEQMKNELIRLSAAYADYGGQMDANLDIMRLRQEMERESLRLTYDQEMAIRELIATSDLWRVKAETDKAIYDSTIGALKELSYELEATAEAYNVGYINKEAYRLSEVRIQVDMKRAALTMTEQTGVVGALSTAWESFHLGILQTAADLPMAFQAIADTVTDGLKQMTDGVGDLVANWVMFGEAMRFIDVFRAVIRQMLSSLVSLAAQMMIVGIARQFAGFGMSQATIPNVPGAGAGAAGSISLPGSTGQSFGGGAMPMMAVGGGGLMPAAPHITINNNSGVALRAEYVGPDEVRLIAEEAVAASAPRVVAGQLANPNSVVSKSLRTNTTSSRRNT